MTPFFAVISMFASTEMAASSMAKPIEASTSASTV